MDIEWGLDGTPTWEKFSKIFLATSFYSITDPLVLKFDLIYLWCPKNSSTAYMIFEAFWIWI